MTDQIIKQPDGVALTLQNVGKQYDQRRVLQQVNLEFKAGEFVAIVGRSGCGKSTLLRLIAGLEQGSGEILYDERAVQGLHPDLRVMFQDSRLLPWKSVLNNVALGLSKTQKPDAERVLNQVGLADRAREWPARLSGGQKQRVALARALVHHPRLLLLDEPLGALDALTRIDMQALIEGLWQRLGFTALLVTHDVSEAIALADRVLLIEDGQITLDERIDLPRPRQRGNIDFAQLEEKILNRVLQKTAA